MRRRTKEFALRIVRLVGALPESNIGWVLGRQVLKSGTSIGANYHEALRASSRRHFLSTIEIALREAEETEYWLDLIGEARLIEPSRIVDLKNECCELIAILTSTAKTLRQSPDP